jgi:FtsP/CotA-like multicopper oxidase with cupredoxin domain
VSRRGLLGGGAALLGAAGASAIGLGAVGLSDRAIAQDGATPTGPGGYGEPAVLASRDGLLAVTLQAQPDLGRGPGRLAYESSLPGPTLRLKPGDELKIALVNGLGGPATNLHLHGFHVSPSGNGDNIFVDVEYGQTFVYEYSLPANHAPGIYWYHPHHHGMANAQVSAGLAGAIVIEGGLDEVPGVAGLTERLLVLQGPFLDARHQTQFLVNGQVNPVIPIQPGETQRWRIANVSANAFYNLQLAGHRLYEIATDGNPLPEVRPIDALLLGPGERSEVLVQGGPLGIYEFRSLAWAQDIPGQAQPQFLVATLASTGEAVEPAPLPTTLLPYDDLSDEPIARQRTITFEERSEPPVFAIDGKAFVADRVDQVVKLGTTEEWVLRNASPEWHPFHIHVNDFQVMSVNGEPVFPHYEDTTLLPPNGEVVIRTRFLDFTGRFVYHCHILGHEDAGMMGVVEVVE